MGKIKELLYDVDVDEQGAFIVEYKEPYVIKCYGCGELAEILDINEDIPTNRGFTVDYKRNRKIAHIPKDYKGTIQTDITKCNACMIAFPGPNSILNILMEEEE